MKRNLSIQSKAGFLLIIFALNTVIGLACSLGIDINFNSNHHKKEQVTKIPIHIHTDGKKHDHHNKASNQGHKEKNSPEKGGCCNNEVVKFQNIEKKINPKPTISAPVFVAITSTFPAVNIVNATRFSPHKKIVRFFYPPPTDILIAIQRFQI